MTVKKIDTFLGGFVSRGFFFDEHVMSQRSRGHVVRGVGDVNPGKQKGENTGPGHLPRGGVKQQHGREGRPVP